MDASSCRLSGGVDEPTVEGRPDALRALATLLEDRRDRVEIVLADGSGRIVRVRTDEPRLRLTAAADLVLRVEGGVDGLAVVVDALRRVADQAEDVGWAPVARHEHLERWGDDDPRFTADSEPVIVASDWPD